MCVYMCVCCIIFPTSGWIAGAGAPGNTRGPGLCPSAPWEPTKANSVTVNSKEGGRKQHTIDLDMVSCTPLGRPLWVRRNQQQGGLPPDLHKVVGGWGNKRRGRCRSLSQNGKPKECQIGTNKDSTDLDQSFHRNHFSFKHVCYFLPFGSPQQTRPKRDVAPTTSLPRALFHKKGFGRQVSFGFKTTQWPLG